MHRSLLRILSSVVILTMLFSGFSLPSASAQGEDGLERQVNAQTGKLSFLGPENGQVLSFARAFGATTRPQDPAMALAKRFGPEFGLKDPGRDLQEMKSHRTDDGRIMARYQQNYQGIPVMGGELIVNTNENGDLYSMNGEVSSNISVSTQPTIDSEQAKQTALQAASKWYQKASEDFLVSEPELWICDESLLRPSTRPVELVWRMEVTPKEIGMPVRELVLVNAQRGNVSLHFNQIDTAWSLNGGSGGSQDPDPTATPLPTETSESEVTPIPIEETTPAEAPSASNALPSDVGPQAATTWYVATTGNAANSCSSAGSPCQTIHSAIGKATTGDTIKVALGTYSSMVINKSITLSGGWNSGFTSQSGQSTIDGQAISRGVTVNTGVTVTIDEMVVQNGNAGFSSGGGIYINSGATLNLNNSIVNSSTGWGIDNRGTLTLNNSTVSGSTDTGIFNWSAVTINTSSISSNGGTGITNNGTVTTLTMNSSTINNNTGYGIDNTGGVVTLNNTTISHNSDTGFKNYGSGTATLNNSTVTGNTGQYSGGILRSAGTIILKNTIVAGNSSTFNGPDCVGSLTSAGYNLIGNATDCILTPGTGDLTNIDPKLGELIGSPGYYPLQVGSPAIDAGNPAVPGSGGNACLANDERGVARPVGVRCDIGAFEYTPPGSPTHMLIVSGDNQHVSPGAALAVPLKVAVLDGQNNPVPNISVTFTTPSSGASGTFVNTGTSTTVTTDANGIATAPTFTANTVSGSYTVIASSSGVASVNFHLLNVIWHVATTGSDTNDCMAPATACATINSAIGKANDGDTIRVATGTYTGTGPEVVLLNKSMTLLGGWNAGFTIQSGTSIIDGQGARRGVTANGTTIAIDRFTIQNGFHDSQGGGLFNNGSALTLSNSIVRNNISHWMGGGIYHNAGTLTINNTAVDNNQAGDPNTSGGGGGGGIHIQSGTVTLNNSTISRNVLVGGRIGSGVDSSGTLILNNSTVSGNSGGTGEGIYTSYLSAIISNNSTISGNQSYGVRNQGGTVTLRNTIIAANGAGGDCYNDLNGNNGTITSQGYNLIGNTSGCNLTPATGDLVNVNANLGQLINSPGYIPLLAGSPAIDAGNPASPGSGGNACLGTDQRGVIRPVGTKCDIGAFEYRGAGAVPAYIYALQGTPQIIEPGGTASTLLKLVVLDLNGDSVPGKTVTFTAPASGASGTFANTHTNISTAITDAGGFVTASAFTANNTSGGYIIRATVSDFAGYADFQFVNGAPKAKTYTANLGTSLPGTFLCDHIQSNCTNGVNPHADAAHKYAIGTYYIYATQYGRDSIDNHGMTIVSSVHYCTSNGCPYSNANWNGEQMVYGDAYGFPLADDVVAHELTHGVTQYESNLFYYYQSGAINESFSDLWGEYYDQTNGLGNDTNYFKWQLGEDVSGMGTLRNMSDPYLSGDPDRMSSPYYYEGEDDNGGVHSNSGVNNKAVYLMVDGGFFNGKTVSPLGWDKTATIYYEANTNLLSSGADYFDLYYALQQACSNLIGQKGITAGDCAEVKDAIDAVEMNAQPAPNFNTDVSYCDAGIPVTTILSDDLESGTGNWTFSNGTHPRWQLDTPYGPYAQSGLHSLFADDYPGVVTDAAARLRSFTVPGNAYLHFAQAYGFESEYNPSNSTFYDFGGGVLEYSLNNGVTWQDAGSLIDYNGYKGTIFTGSDNPLSGRSAFVGDSHGYISTRLNLYPLVGQTVSFRWRMGLDEAGGDWGWWLDNIQVYTCPVVLNRDTTGVFRPSNGLLYLKNSNTTGFADAALNYGLPGDYPVVGDWDGNGTVTIGIYRKGTFYLRNENTIGFATVVFDFGQIGDQPIAGDWDGDGVDTIGIFRPSNGQFQLRNSNDAGPAEMSFYLGNAGDVGVAGDWNGDGKDTTGVFRPSNGIIFLKDTNDTGFADYALNYGLPGDKPVMGDWNDDGIDTIGIYRNGLFYLRNSNTNGFAEIIFGLGIPGDMPIAGNWDALP